MLDKNYLFNIENYTIYNNYVDSERNEQYIGLIFSFLCTKTRFLIVKVY